MIRGLNHITLATNNLNRAVNFYENVLGLKVEKVWSAGAYLSAGSLWLCLSVDETAKASSDYTHFAFDVSPEGYEALVEKLYAHGAEIWKENRSEGASVYFCDPDGHRLELHVGDLASRLDAMHRELQTC